MKQPAFQFYTGDWLKDPELSMCHPASRGIWIDAVAAMHERKRSGRITGTPAQLARVCRCSEPEMLAAITDIDTNKAAGVRWNGDGTVTLINRRMEREANERNGSRNRQFRKRHASVAGDVTPASRENDGGVTPKSRAPSSSSSSPSGGEASTPPDPPDEAKPEIKPERRPSWETAPSPTR